VIVSEVWNDLDNVLWRSVLLQLQTDVVSAAEQQSRLVPSHLILVAIDKSQNSNRNLCAAAGYQYTELSSFSLSNLVHDTVDMTQWALVEQLMLPLVDRCLQVCHLYCFKQAK